MYLCPCCQQTLPWTEPAVVNVERAVQDDILTEQDAFKRTYVGHGKQSSVFIFQGHKGPFRKHIHVTHDEIGYVLAGTGSVTIGDDTRPVRPGDVWIIPSGVPHSAEFGDEPVRVLFVSSPIDDPDNQDRIWADGQP
jgi:quercetin dioxygenase-like cupin family protein